MINYPINVTSVICMHIYHIIMCACNLFVALSYPWPPSFSSGNNKHAIIVMRSQRNTLLFVGSCLASNQSFYRQFAGYGKGLGHHNYYNTCILTAYRIVSTYQA